MSTPKKLLLVVILLFGFCPITLLWVWGLLAVPTSLRDTIQGTESYLRFLSAMLFGGFGIVGVVLGSASLVSASSKKVTNTIAIFFIALGVLALCLGIAKPFRLEPGAFLFFWFPLAVAIYLEVMVTRQLTTRSRRTP